MRKEKKERIQRQLAQKNAHALARAKKAVRIAKAAKRGAPPSPAAVLVKSGKPSKLRLHRKLLESKQERAKRLRAERREVVKGMNIRGGKRPTYTDKRGNPIVQVLPGSFENGKRR